MSDVKKVPIQLGGRERLLCFTNRSLTWLRDEFKIDAIKEFGSGGGDLLDTLPVIICCGLRWADPNNPSVAIKWDLDNPHKQADGEPEPIDLRLVKSWFLDEGNLQSNQAWSLDVYEALIGKRPELKDEPANPPSTDGASA